MTRPPLFRARTSRPAQNLQAADAADGFVGIREMKADVALADRAEHGVGDGVAEHVGIRMAIEAVCVRDIHAAEDELAALDEAVNVVTDAGECS